MARTNRKRSCSVRARQQDAQTRGRKHAPPPPLRFIKKHKAHNIILYAVARLFLSFPKRLHILRNVTNYTVGRLTVIRNTRLISKLPAESILAKCLINRASIIL